MTRRVKLIKNRSDIGAGTRGSDLGVDALEIAAINQKSDFFNRYPYEDVDTHNESIYNKVHNSFAKRIRHVYEQCSRVSGVVKRTLVSKEFPVVFSGDHSASLGTISGIRAAFPEKKIGVIWIDAHADLHSPYTSPSGNIHGMPLAAAIGRDNLSCQINTVSEETATYWKAMKNLGIPGPNMEPQHIVYFGVRDTEPPEEQQMEEHNMRNFMVAETRHRTMEVCVAEALEILKPCDVLYISFDVDSMDCDMISNGTGTPVPKGFDQYEVISIINQLLDSEKVICIEFVEINPLLDHKGNKMAETAFEVLNALKL